MVNEENIFDDVENASANFIIEIFDKPFRSRYNDFKDEGKAFFVSFRAHYTSANHSSTTISGGYDNAASARFVCPNCMQ